MNRPSSPRGVLLPAAAIGLAAVAVLAIVAGGAFGRAPDPARPALSDRPSPAPTARPTPPPSAVPSADPSDAPGDGTVKVDLDIATDHAVSVVIDDQAGLLLGASSGRAADGLSVRWFDLKVENLDDRTLRLTWVGLPVNEEIELQVSARDDGRYRLRMVQSGPPPNSDALGFDRVLVLQFAGPVSAEQVLATIQGSLGTAD